MKRGAIISNYLKPLCDAPCQAYLTADLQVADVLEWILEQVGAASIYQTSFSISEEFLRRLYFIRRQGLMDSLSLVLDMKATNKTVKLWPFISQVADKAYLADNHSKILLVVARSGERVAVVTSQNLTRGNRYESAIVTSLPAVCEPLLQQLNDLITYHAVPLNDLFSGNASTD